MGVIVLAVLATAAYVYGTSDHVRMQRATARYEDRVHWWQIEVQHDTADDHGPCRFYTALAPVTDTFGADYVVLGDGRIVGIDLTGDEGLTAVLRHCGSGASASWWIDRVSTPTETVLDTPSPPTLTVSGTATELVYTMRSVASLDLGFGAYLSDLEPGTYRVRVELPASGDVSIERTPIAAP